MTPSSTFLATDGAAYEQLMGRWSRRLAEPFLEFVGAAAGERVLDVGCGTGALASALARRVPVAELCAVDPKGGEQRRARNYTRPMTRLGELVDAWHAAGLPGRRVPGQPGRGRTRPAARRGKARTWMAKPMGHAPTPRWRGR